jgi:nitric oxide reductase NorD protein
MAEAEDLITDVARHATVYARELWLRRRGRPEAAKPVQLAQVRSRLDLLAAAVFGQAFSFRAAQPPAYPTMLTRIFRRHDVLPSRVALPATDGRSVWLPPDLGITDPQAAIEVYRTLALIQGMRAVRGSAQYLHTVFPAARAAACKEIPPACPRMLAAYLLLEAQAADHELVKRLPGVRRAIEALRARALAARPAVAILPEACRPLEARLQSALAAGLDEDDGLPLCPVPGDSLELARVIVDDLDAPPAGDARRRTLPHTHALVKDWWTGELMPAPAYELGEIHGGGAEEAPPDSAPRSARLTRRPKERPKRPGEDEGKQGVWMVQTNDPLNKAEDPLGLQRPVDRDESTAADEYADAVSELSEARLVSSVTPATEVLLSDDPPDRHGLKPSGEPRSPRTGRVLRYPEWDYRMDGYRHPGASVHVLAPEVGPDAWVQSTLAHHCGLANVIRKHFDALRPDRQWLRRQADGDEIDLDACVDAIADARAGRPIPYALYRQQRPRARNMAIMLLVDISGSTDSWLAADRRIIDVEREALLLVTLALERMGEMHAIQAFSGEGPHGVTVRPVKDFGEQDAAGVARRIAALEPQYYTRSGAALRHSTAELMRQPARHRLLMLLSDGKPNDSDMYEGRYGVEDTRRAVMEARMQGVSPFCLTIDRQAAGYLSRIFGLGQYALIQDPRELPRVLVEWLRRLIGSGA